MLNPPFLTRSVHPAEADPNVVLIFLISLPSEAERRGNVVAALSHVCSLVSRNAVVLPRCLLEALVGPSLLPAWSGDPRPLQNFEFEQQVQKLGCFKDPQV